MSRQANYDWPVRITRIDMVRAGETLPNKEVKENEDDSTRKFEHDALLISMYMYGAFKYDVNVNGKKYNLNKHQILNVHNIVTRLANTNRISDELVEKLKDYEGYQGNIGFKPISVIPSKRGNGFVKIIADVVFPIEVNGQRMIVYSVKLKAKETKAVEKAEANSENTEAAGNTEE